MLCALAVISPLLASIIIQDKTNTIVGAPVQNTAVEQPVAEEATEATSPEVTAE
ncbi:MAG: hypothetical protein IKU43_02090 [Clostridia bacterium]|nr:hypothetical protein [Clostridia bacterium]